MNVDEYMGGSTTTAKEMVQAISTDERRLGELEDLFNWVDVRCCGLILRPWATCLRASVPACKRACVPAYLRTCVPACLRACVPALLCLPLCPACAACAACPACPACSCMRRARVCLLAALTPEVVPSSPPSPQANGDGYIEADELAAVAAAVGTFEDGPESGAPSESFFAGLLEHAQQIASKGSKRGSGAPMALDFEAFLRIMTSKAVAEYKVPETELELAFVALDVDGDGEISKAEFLAAMESVRASLSSSGVWSFTEQDMEDAFAAADRDHTGTIDYEEFVSVMSDMTVAKIVPK